MMECMLQLSRLGFDTDNVITVLKKDRTESIN